MGDRPRKKVDASDEERSASPMTFDQIAALAVLIGVVGVLIHGKIRNAEAPQPAADLC